MAGSLERFLTIAQQHADRPAIVEQSAQGSAILRYGELQARVERLGSLLIERGFGPEQIVAIDLPKSAALVVAALASWYAGAAFLPLEWSLPRARREAYLRQANVALAITTESAESRVPEDIPCLGAEAPRRGRTLPAVTFDAERLAYVISTSGSSGAPKAVAVTHRGLLPLLGAQIRAFRLEPGARSLWLLSPAFDASISDWGTALLSGATLYLDQRLPAAGPRAIQEAISRNEISYVDLPPALLPHLPVGPYASLQTVVIGGEVAESAAVRRWSTRVRLINVYGPTETTICTSYRVADATWEKPLLGPPIDRDTVDYTVRDLEGRRCAPGAAGELYISGACLARGYLGQPELTQSRFVQLEGERAFRSGDRVVQRVDGEFEFLGRIDRQIKVRGALVAPEEVEAQLLSVPGVRRAVVLEWGPQKRLTAFLEGERMADSELRSRLTAQLPGYMVPERFEWLDVLPLTASGKPDLAELRRSRSRPPSPLFETEVGLEQRVATWYARVLESDVGPDADFFVLGGNSLRALELVALAARDGFELTPELLFKTPRVGALAESLRSRDPARGKSSVELKTRLLEEGLVPHSDQPPTVSAESRTPAQLTLEEQNAVFVTGATGFLGARLILELLDQTRSQIWCLVRAADEATAQKRVLDALAMHRRSALHHGRIRCVVGDLVRPTLAREHADYGALVRDIHTIFHCGAAVSLMADCDSLWETNVLGTDRILRLCEQGRPKSLHYASTLSVFVSARSSQEEPEFCEYLEADCLDEARVVFGGYAQTKWAAEVLVRARVNPRTATFIHRLGLLTGDSSTGRGADRDWLALVLRGLTKLGVYPQSYDAQLAVDITPVDYVARAWVHLARQTARPGQVQTTHLAGPRAVGFGDLVTALRSAGVRLEPVEPSTWRSRLSEALESRGEPELASAFLALRRVTTGDRPQRALDLFQATRCRFDDRETRTLLAPSGIECPPATAELLREYARHTLSTERSS